MPYETATAVYTSWTFQTHSEGTASLVDKSLVQQEGEEEPRFSLLETIREYAAEKLAERGEEQGVRNAHAIYFTEPTERGAPKLYGPEQKEWQDRLQREHDNLRAVLEWSLRGGDPVHALRLAGAIVLFWADRGHISEGRRWLEMILAAHSGASTSSLAKALDGAGMLARFQGDLGHARRRLEEGLSVYRAVGDRRGEGMALTHLGGLARLEGDLERAAKLLGDCVVLEREVGDPHYLTSALTNLGEVRMRQGRYTEARRLLDEALALRQNIGDQVSLGQTLVALGRVEQLRGDGDQPATCFRDALAILRAVGSLPWTIEALEGLAGVADGLGDVAWAARLRGAVAAARERIGQFPQAGGQANSGPPEGADGQCSEAEWRAAWEEGHALGLKEAIDYALGESV